MVDMQPAQLRQVLDALDRVDLCVVQEDVLQLLQREERRGVGKLRALLGIKGLQLREDLDPVEILQRLTVKVQLAQARQL